MDRRGALRVGLGGAVAGSLGAVPAGGSSDAAAVALDRAVASGLVRAAVLHVESPAGRWSRAWGVAADALFLLGSISKPISAAALMTLVASGAVGLDDPVRRTLPEVEGEGRERITLRHLLTHVSGLPDQLPDNDTLRRSHAPLAEFAACTARTPLGFVPGQGYRYSSMGILLAARVAERISGEDFRTLVGRTVLAPLGMTRAALGMGQFHPSDTVPCQTEHAAPEAGGGDPGARDWDWNSPWWRGLGAPWGGVQASAADVAAFLGEFLHGRGRLCAAETERSMITNHNPPGIRPRGLGFDVGTAAGIAGCSVATFGHTGSTGTIGWADPATGTICVVLTSWPARAVVPHPRDETAALVAAAARGGQ